jgi:hypothetical protein
VGVANEVAELRTLSADVAATGIHEILLQVIFFIPGHNSRFSSLAQPFCKNATPGGAFGK